MFSERTLTSKKGERLESQLAHKTLFQRQYAIPEQQGRVSSAPGRKSIPGARSFI
jgi:hypothetical protein